MNTQSCFYNHMVTSLGEPNLNGNNKQMAVLGALHLNLGLLRRAQGPRQQGGTIMLEEFV